MSDDELGGELDRVLRVALTAGGQLAERLARSRAEEERGRRAAALDALRRDERETARHVEAGRAVYGSVRDQQLWEQPDAQRRLGEALVVAESLREADLVAGPAARYIRAEARRRHGPDSDAWLAAGVQTYLEEIGEETDRRAAQQEPRQALLEQEPRQALLEQDAGADLEATMSKLRAEATPMVGDILARGRAAEAEAALAGLDSAEYLRLVQPRHYQDVVLDHLVRENGITRSDPEELWADWRMEQALAQLTRPEPVVLAARADTAREPYSAALQEAARSEAERAGVDVTTYLGHLEEGHHEQLMRAWRNPGEAQRWDGFQRISARRVAYVQKSIEQGRPVAGQASSGDQVEGEPIPQKAASDTPQRRATDRESLEGIDPRVAQNRMHADTAAGTPATSEATVAAEAFPRTAAEDLLHARPRKAAAARPESSRERTRDRAR